MPADQKNASCLPLEVVILLALSFSNTKCYMTSTMLMLSFPLSSDYIYMLAFQPLSPGSTHKTKLGTVCVCSRIWHGQEAKTCMIQDGVLILKFLFINVSVTSWCQHPAHKSWNNSGKGGTFISKSFLSSAQSMKVFCCLWTFVYKQLKGGAAQGLIISKDTVGLIMAATNSNRGQRYLQRPHIFNWSFKNFYIFRGLHSKYKNKVYSNL